MHCLSRRGVRWLILAASLQAFASVSLAQARSNSSCFSGTGARTSDADDFFLAGEQQEGPDTSAVTIESDIAEFHESGRMELEGDVLIQRPGYRAHSDSAMIDQQSGQAELSGQILIESPRLVVSGEEAMVNMNSRQAKVSQASFTNPQTRMRGSAEIIEQRDGNQVLIQDGSFTTCEPNDNAWAIRASEIRLDQEGGFGEAKHTRFEILDTPVLYIPWFTFPIDDRRKSGFLYPTVGSSNTGQGFFISTPYYFNIAPEFDATLTPSSIHGRGLHTELELRHLSSFSNTEVGFGYIGQDKDYREDVRALRDPDESGERWGFSFEQELDFYRYDSPWYGRIDFSDISDDEYLEDLNQGLQIENQDNLDRRARFTYAQPSWLLDVQLQQYLNIDRNLPKNEEAFQRLPEINYQGFFYHRNLELDWRSQYVYFYRDPDDLIGIDKTHGSRLRHTPRVSLPWYKSWGYLKPAMQLDHTDYAFRAYGPEDNHESRTIPFYELDAGLYLDRETRVFGTNYLNSLEPRFYYVYSPYREQDDLPNFDSSIPSFSYQRLFQANRFSGGDRVGDNNRATLGFTSRWTDVNSGLDRVVLSLGQVFHYSDRRVSVNGLGTSKRSDSLLASEALYRPWPEVEMSLSGLWDARSRSTQEGTSRITYRQGDGGAVLNLSHRFRENDLEQSDSSFILPLGPELSVLGRWRYDLDDNRTIGTLAGIEYNSCCWRVQFLAQRYLNDQSELTDNVLLRFQLIGLGGFGADADQLDDEIPGYKAREDYFD